MYFTAMTKTVLNTHFGNWHSYDDYLSRVPSMSQMLEYYSNFCTTAR